MFPHTLTLWWTSRYYNDCYCLSLRKQATHVDREPPCLKGIFIQEGSSGSRFDHGQFEIKAFPIYAPPYCTMNSLQVTYFKMLKLPQFPWLKHIRGQRPELCKFIILFKYSLLMGLYNVVWIINMQTFRCNESHILLDSLNLPQLCGNCDSFATVLPKKKKKKKSTLSTSSTSKKYCGKL